MVNRWYNSDIASKIGTGVVIVGIGLGIATMVRSCENFSTTPEIEMEKVRRTPQLQTADLNGNGIPEKFYTIDGKVALVELDGKPVSELYRR